MNGLLRRGGLVCAGMLVMAAAMCAPAGAAQVVDENYLPFAHCPIENKSVKLCVVATTTSGEFVMGSKTVDIEHPVVLQGGIRESEGNQELVAPTNAPIMSAPAMKVQGGLVGIELLPTLTEVTATTELNGPVFLNLGAESSRQGAAVILPLQAKLGNTLLGNECIVGNAAEPILLHLTTGTTSPPPPNSPISGATGKFSIHDEIDELTGTSLVDNSFSAPGVNGCGESLSVLLDPLVDLSAGLPSASGHNTAILNGTVLLATAKAVKKSHVEKKPKEKKSKT
jgi:hypothetical protein